MMRPLWLLLAAALPCRAVLFLETADPAHNTTTPGDNSGWQFEGKFLTFLGVPVAPHFFITANHFGGTVGAVFDFHGDPYVTIARHPLAGTDLVLWEVDHAKPFPTWAPLSSGVADLGATATVFGRGTQRGPEVLLSGVLKGWQWGPADDVQRWGRNQIAAVKPDAGLGELLECEFNRPGVADECHLSTGDSGGGLFVLEAGLWRLAGIHYGVDGPFRIPPSTAEFSAALFDVGGLEEQQGTMFVKITDRTADVPSSFYSSRISASRAAIIAIAPEAAALAPEDFGGWLRLYFSPAEIADPAVSGPQADPDGDGVENLIEFALHLDPTFREAAVMTAGTGLRGLPLVRPGPAGLVMEFVRRTAGISYVPEFSRDLTTWTGGTVTAVTALNPRWERVTVTAEDPAARFARLRVVLHD